MILSKLYIFTGRNILIYVFLFLVVPGYNQDIVELVKAKQKSYPTDLIIYVDSILFYNTSLKDDEIAEIKYYQALAYQKNSNHEMALKLYKEFSPKIEKSSKLYVRTLLQESNSNVYLNNFTEATEQALEAFSIAEKEGFEKLKIASNSALSFILYSTGDYEGALGYLVSSMEFQRITKDSLALSSTYNNIAILYKSTLDFENALYYNNESLKISFAADDYVGIGKSYSNIGRIYEELGNFTKAISYYKNAIENNIKSEISNSIPYRNLAEVYVKMKNFEQAEKQMLNALAIEKTNNNQANIQKIYFSLLNIAIHAKDFEKAIWYKDHLKKVDDINKAHASEEKVKMIENQYKLYRSKNELSQIKKINNKNKIIFGLLLGTVGVVFLLWYQNSRNKQLKSEKEKVDLEQIVLRAQMNPHFIFNALSAIQSSLLDNEPLKSATYLSRFAKLIRQNFDFINQNSIPLGDEIDALRNYLDTQQMRFKDKFDYEINVRGDVDMDLLDVPPLLIQPFVENSIEHGFKNKKEKGLLQINIVGEKNKVCYEIIDNGIGYTKGKKDDKLHAIDIFKKRLKLLGHQDEKTFEILNTTNGTVVKFCLKK